MQNSLSPHKIGERFCIYNKKYHFIDLKLLCVYAKKLQRCHIKFIKISYNKKHKIDFERTKRI